MIVLLPALKATWERAASPSGTADVAVAAHEDDGLLLRVDARPPGLEGVLATGRHGASSKAGQ